MLEQAGNPQNATAVAELIRSRDGLTLPDGHWRDSFRSRQLPLAEVSPDAAHLQLRAVPPEIRDWKWPSRGA